MPSLGQTLCQLGKTFLNQQLESVKKFFTADVAGERAKNPVFVASQRQHSCFV
jgi:hypothetical protein